MKNVNYEKEFFLLQFDFTNKWQVQYEPRYKLGTFVPDPLS